eukprot:scaffold11552_cov50-Attheya_sp.AAC.10
MQQKKVATVSRPSCGGARNRRKRGVVVSGRSSSWRMGRIMGVKMLVILLWMGLLSSLSIMGTCSSSSFSVGNDLYKILGVPKDASSGDVQKAYRRMALKHHPDKVPSEQREQASKTFKEIGRAYDVLNDDDKRKQYDQYGPASLEPNFQPAFSSSHPHGPGGGGAAPQFSFSSPGGHNGVPPSMPGFSFFGNPGGAGGGGAAGLDLDDILASFMGQDAFRASSADFARQQQPQQPPRQQQQPPQRVKEYTRSVYCTLKELAINNARGKVVKKLKVTLKDGRERIFPIVIQPGWKEGTKIRFKATVQFPAHLTFVIKERPHTFLIRQGNDLIWPHCKLTPGQVERGAKLKIPLPQNEENVKETIVVPPGTANDTKSMIIPNKGMPIQGRPERGNLIIHFQIMPSSSHHKTTKEEPTSSRQ